MVQPEESEFPRASWRVVAVDVLFIFLVFFVYAGAPAPDVNEAHYLAKARNYWDPPWCAGDLFLQSRDAHLVFYWTFGWTTSWLSLAAAAWLGRVVTWLAMALAWQKLSYTVCPRPLAAVLSAALWVSFLDRAHLAGEWVIGGVEAKGLAYVLVLLALADFARGNWKRPWLMLGAASACHVLVGGWTVCAALVAWGSLGQNRTPLRHMIPALAGGLGLALPGLLPALALNGGTAPDTVRMAESVYVYERLAHHLVFRQFAPERVASFVALLAVWLVAWRWARATERLGIVQRIVCGAAAIAAVGVLLDGLSPIRPSAAAALLRFYWFRLSDSLVPLGAALSVTAIVTRRPAHQTAAAVPLLVAALALVSAFLVSTFVHHVRDPRPPAVAQSTPSSSDDYRERYLAWLDTCQWIRTHTRPGAVFLTPRNQQTFKWYAERAEVAAWKDVPQDAESLMEWWRRQQDIYSPEVLRHGLAALGDERLAQLARKYSADYIVLDRTRSSRPVGLRRVYPTVWERTARFEVYAAGQ